MVLRPRLDCFAQLALAEVALDCVLADELLHVIEDVVDQAVVAEVMEVEGDNFLDVGQFSRPELSVVADEDILDVSELLVFAIPKDPFEERFSDGHCIWVPATWLDNGLSGVEVVDGYQVPFLLVHKEPKSDVLHWVRGLG